jgi:hypothetical protein
MVLQAPHRTRKCGLACVIASGSDSLPVESFTARSVLTADCWRETVHLFEGLLIVEIGTGTFSRALRFEAVHIGHQQDLLLD